MLKGWTSVALCGVPYMHHSGHAIDVFHVILRCNACITATEHNIAPSSISLYTMCTMNTVILSVWRYTLVTLDILVNSIECSLQGYSKNEPHGNSKPDCVSTEASRSAVGWPHLPTILPFNWPVPVENNHGTDKVVVLLQVKVKTNMWRYNCCSSSYQLGLVRMWF